jgi:peptidyl-prolyl cis-trans isomerase SurA
MQKRNILFLSTLLILNFLSINLVAQKNIIDEVIWIVGDEAILRSEVEEKIDLQYYKFFHQGIHIVLFRSRLLFRNFFYIRRSSIVLW